MTAANSPGAIAEYLLLPIAAIAAAYYVWLVVSAWCAHRVARAVDCAIVHDLAARLDDPIDPAAVDRIWAGIVAQLEQRTEGAE